MLLINSHFICHPFRIALTIVINIAGSFSCDSSTVLTSHRPSARVNTSIILIKTKRPPRDNDFNFITPSCVDFEDFLTDCNLVVDKSLLVKRILSYTEDILIISAPAVFGKTTNLGMIRFFFECQFKHDCRLEIEQSSSYKYFKYGRYVADDGHHVFSGKPLIANDEQFIHIHQGNYPVIHLDFKPPNGVSYTYKIEQIERIIGDKISREFRRHYYVQKYYAKLIANRSIDDGVKQLAKLEWKQFELVALNRELDWTNMWRSLRFLSEVLYKFFERKVLILVDELDSLVNHVKEDWIYLDEPPPKDQHIVMNFLKNLFNCTFVSNDVLFKVICTGQTISCIDELFSTSTVMGKSIRLFDAINHHTLAEFYGFTETVSESLLQIGNVSREVADQAMNWFKGYNFNANFNCTIICPWDVIQVIDRKTVSNYWIKFANAKDKMSQLITLDFMKPTMKGLLRSESIGVCWTSVEFSNEDFARYFDLVYERVVRPGNNDTSLVLKRLYAAGYVTLAGIRYDQRFNENCYLVRIPNREIASEIENSIKLHAEHFYERRF